MRSPKCRICGVREHNHRCRGGTPAMRIEERARAREADPHRGCPAWPNCTDDPSRCLVRGSLDMDDVPGHRDAAEWTAKPDTAARAMRIEERARGREAEVSGSRVSDGRQWTDTHTNTHTNKPGAVVRRWHDDTDSAGEPTEVTDHDRRPARFYAPPGRCVYCDRRRDAARRSMAAVRERGTDA